MKEKGKFLTSMVSAVTSFLIIRIVVSFFGLELYDNYWWIAGGLSFVMLKIALFQYQDINKQYETGKQVQTAKILTSPNG